MRAEASPHVFIHNVRDFNLLTMKDRKYRPTNGTEGMCFEESFCHQCINERWVHKQDEDREKDKCPIYSKMMLLEVDDPEYPSELTYDENDKPTCTEWVKWDWGNDGDPNDPDNPKAPEPPKDPNQLDLFPLYPDEEDCKIISIREPIYQKILQRE